MHRKVLAVLLVLAFWAGMGLLRTGEAQARDRVWNFTRIDPTTGPWGTTVRLYGYGFGKDVKVYYDGQLVAPVSIGRRVIVVKIPDNSRTAWFEVAIGDRQLRSPVMFRVKNTPVVTGLVPSSGPPGIWITVQGKHLHRGMKFWIGHSPVRRQYVSATMFKVLIYKGVKGGNLYYFHQGRKHRTRYKFRISKFPTIMGFSPSKGYFGDRVTINGANFCPTSRVYLNGVEVKVQNRIGLTRIIVQLPARVSTGRFEVECYGKRVTHADEFLVEPPFAEVTGITPSAGKAGRWITVVGLGFTAKDRFWLGNRILRKKYVSSRQVKIMIPAGARTQPIYYQSYGKRFKSSFEYHIYRPPVITGFSPRSAWYAQYVTIRGRNFCPMIQVYLGRQLLTVVRRQGSQSVTVQIPQGARPDRFIVRCLKWKATSAGRLSLQAPKAGVKKVTPLSAPPGSEVTIEGFNLRATDQFLLGKTRLPMAYESGNKVTVTIPRGARSGVLYHVSLGRKVQTPFRITVGWPKPVLRGFTPKVSWYGEVVTIQGKDVCDGPIVRLGGKVVPVVNSTKTEIQVTVPRGSRGGLFRVKCHDHLVVVPGRLRLKAPFAQITSIYPQFGPWGTWITLTGQNFQTGDRFWIGRKAINDVRRISENEVRIKVPRGASGGRIIMVSRGRRSVTGHFFRLVFPVPQITRVRPNEGWWGDSVVIKGQNFCNNPVVRFGRRVASRALRTESDTIKVIVPRQTHTARIEVRCMGKVGRSPKPFKIVKPKPRIVDLFPGTGPPKRWVSVTGHNLDRVSKAWLNHRRYGRVQLVVKHQSKTMIKVYIPEGCKGGALEIEAYGKRSTTSFAYIVPRRYR